MTDIVERLRSRSPYLQGSSAEHTMAEAADEIERLKAYAQHERSLGAEGPMIELMSAQQEIERLKAYAQHERSLGAKGPMIELMSAQQEIERLKAAIAWTREVRPGKNPESGGAIVHMTWDQFNAMRALALEPKL